MKNPSFRGNFVVLLTCFVLSRVIVKFSGVTFFYNAIFEYWQYLDLQSLQHNLLKSLWYQHSQPPVFNLLLGIVLKLSRSEAPLVFEVLFLVISFSNAYLLLSILQKTTRLKYLPLLLALIYALSPATILYENELFYTQFTSFLLLLLIFFLVNFVNKRTSLSAAGIFATLTLLCLSRSTYHLVLLLLVCVILLLSFYRKPGFKLVIIGSLICFGFVGGWYAKNYLVFGSFAPSSWLGINLSRIVFHDVEISDSSTIASVHPGLPLSYYKKYIGEEYKRKYAGLNDRVLLHEMKNDTFINMNSAGYLEVSKKYMEASTHYILKNPGTYFAHALTSLVISFTPASSYFKVQENNNKIRYYDLVCSFNLSHLFKEKNIKRVALVISAIPLMLAYVMTFFVLIRDAIERRYIPTVNMIIAGLILFIVMVSTIFEYGENMRFRYELQPLFLILVSQAILVIQNKSHADFKGEKH